MNTGVHFDSVEKSCRFSVWAPLREQMTLHIVYPTDQKLSMEKQKDGYFVLQVKDIEPGCRYFFMPDNEKDYPDPASYYQPESVHGPSEVIDHGAYEWKDIEWKGLPFKDLIIYEIHIGTFSKEGTFVSAIPLLDDLVETGINAVEIMPVAQFPGSRNWGYDGVYPYAVQNSYGGPEGLKKFVDACHQKGIVVILDVVYNHMGPDGNYFSQFGPYFTDKYHCPWGDAINFDGAWSDGVRDYFSDNPLHWFTHYHIDGLRLDAIHTIFDNGAVSIWELMHTKIHLLEQQLGRALYMIAESDLNSPRVLKDPEYGGYGFDAQWLDDFHHSIYVLLDENGKERYKDFGRIEQLAKAYTDGFVHSGEYVAFRNKKYGASSATISGDRFVAFINNHDQCGNRPDGKPLSMLIDFERMKLAAAALLLSPYIPMLFMGEEYASDRPFFFFADYTDPELSKTVHEGRKKEFSAFSTTDNMPDPGSEQTYKDSILNFEDAHTGKKRIMNEWYKTLISFRKKSTILQSFNKNNIRAHILGEGTLLLYRQNEGGLEHMLIFLNFSNTLIRYTLPDYHTEWGKTIDSTDVIWREEGNEKLPSKYKAGEHISVPACSAVVFSKYDESLLNCLKKQHA
jgi:maltooligosyltrehalose trehalohydrolase